MAGREDSKETNSDLKQRLADVEHNFQHLSLAFEQLKEENERITIQMENLMHENTEKIEGLEQERHSLQLKLVQQAKMADSYLEEIEATKTSLTKQHQAVVEKLDSQHVRQIERLNKQIADLQSDLEQSQLSESQLQLEKEKLESAVIRLKNELEACSTLTSESNVEDVDRLSDELSALKKDKVLIGKELMDARSGVEQLELSVARLKKQLQQQVQETEEKQCEATSYYNIIERLHEEIQELKVELDLARMEATSMKKKGNSLFAEVEDRRVEAEKQLISVRIQNESLRKQLDLTKQNLYSVKMQMASLLQMSNFHADVRHIEQLTVQLSQASGEAKFLTGKLNESEQREKVLRDELLSLKGTSSGGDNDHYTKYLQVLLQRKEIEMADLQKELQTQRLLTLAETENLAKCEQKLYAAEQHAGSLRSQKVKLSLKIEEMQLKYEPDLLVTGTLRKVRVEQIPMSSSSSSSSKQASEGDAADAVMNDKMASPGHESCSAPPSIAKENCDPSFASSPNLLRENSPRAAPSCLPTAVPCGSSVGDGLSTNAAIKTTAVVDTNANSDRHNSILAHQSSLNSDRSDNESPSQPKSILIQSGRTNSVVGASKPALKPSKKVTVSSDVQILDGLTNEVSYSATVLNDTDKASQPIGFNRLKDRPKQSRVVSVSSDGQMSTNGECKMQ